MAVRLRRTVRTVSAAGPAGGSKSRLRSTRRGGVAQGQSKRLIIAVSVVRIHPPLPATRFAAATRSSPNSRSWLAVLVEGARAVRRPSRPANCDRSRQGEHRPGPRAQPEHRRFGEAEADEAANQGRAAAGRPGTAPPARSGRRQWAAIPHGINPAETAENPGTTSR
jgi:hypothetical protein